MMGSAMPKPVIDSQRGEMEPATASALYPTYARAELVFENGEGAWLFTQDGRKFLDFASGIAVNALGYGHPHLVSALKAQAEKLWHVSNIYRIPEGERLAKRLTNITFADRVFFTNSGAEALECAIKTARKYHAVQGHPEKFRLITFEGAFHGRTLATIAAGGQQKYIDGFGPKVDGFDQVPFGDHAALKAAITAETAGILIEPIQGEGGVRPVPPQCLRGLRELCDEKGILLLLDEVQCGVGRTGKLFAHEWAGITPDIMAIAKGIGGGFPMGACLARKEAASGMVLGSHGSTFGGNLLAMAVGNAVLDVITADGFLDNVLASTRALTQRLSELKDRFPNVIADIRGSGLLMGMKTHCLNTDFVAKAREEGILTVGAGENVVRLLPPLIIGEAEIHAAFERLERTCMALSPS